MARTIRCDHSLRNGHEILRSGKPAPQRHRLEADADSYHARQGVQAASSSTFAKIVERASGVLETVQTYIAALSWQSGRQDLLRHVDSKGNEGFSQNSEHQQEHFTAHSAPFLRDRTFGSGRRSAGDQSSAGTRERSEERRVGKECA